MDNSPSHDSQYGDLDAQITTLMRCTPLPEADVKVLCDKAREILVRSLAASLALMFKPFPVSIAQCYLNSKISCHTMLSTARFFAIAPAAGLVGLVSVWDTHWLGAQRCDFSV